MDKFWQALYGECKRLIHKGFLQIARFLGSPASQARQLSRSLLDNAVDKSGQVLYGRAKCLICLESHCAAFFLRSLALLLPDPADPPGCY
ncbi:MAG: hypothetical protein M9929_15165 [Burkholderiaceae bacterium]|nr:hypothetical protein [Burkholderiaceae bacterium]